MLTKRVRPILLTLLMIAAAVSVAKAGYRSQRMGFSETYPLQYKDWGNAFPAGNGRMGVMVFGNPTNETIIFNDRNFNMAKTQERSFAQVSAADLMTIKSNCAAGNYAEADQLAVSSAHYHDGGEGGRHPGFEMLITLPGAGAISNYSRACDFRTGEISVKWTDGLGGWVRKTFVSRKDNVTVQYLTAPTRGKLTCSLQLTTDPGMNFPADMTFTSRADTNDLNLRASYPARTGGAGYEGVVRVVTAGGAASVRGSILTISNADSVILLTRTAKYYQDCERAWNRLKLQGQLASVSADYDELRAGQIATHGTIFDRVKVDFGARDADRALPNETLLSEQANSPAPVAALWERVFDAGRYYFLSSSSSETPPDLLGIWTGDCNAGWGGFYTLDANLNLQVAGGNIGDMPEAMAGYFAINQKWRPGFETNAAKLLGCRGMLAAGNTPGTNGLISGINDYYPYHYATGEAGWLLYPFWEHYLITGDTNFLREQLYPLLKDMGCFYEDFLKYTDTNGNYVFAGSISPENQPANVRVSLVNNSAFDVSGARFCLSALIQTCGILAVDQGPGEGLERWRGIFHKLPPYLINHDGALQEWGWPGLADNYNHRHSSGLLPVWPFREITPENKPADYAAAVATLAKKDQFNYENAGHGLLHSALIAANLKNGEAVQKKLLRLTREGFYYDSLCSSHYDKHGVFCTDTCNAVPGIMMEMLVSSDPGVLELLPALPSALSRGAISGVKGRNRVTVQNLSWDMEKNTVNCILKSDIDQNLTLIERRGIESIHSDAGLGDSPLGRIARVVHLKAGVPVNISLRQLKSFPGISTAVPASDGGTGS